MIKFSVFLLLSWTPYLLLLEAKLMNVPKNIEELMDPELLAWEPPDYLRKNFTYYLSGVDDEGRTIWVLEWGRWNTVRFAENGGTELEMFEKYIAQMFANFVKSVEANAVDENFPTESMIGIFDLEDLPIEVMTSLRNTQMLVRLFGKYIRNNVIQDLLHKAYLVNTNFVAEGVLRLIRPIIGEVYERLEIYGSNKERWLPVLAKNIPRSQIPSWYGGKSKDFKPLKVFG